MFHFYGHNCFKFKDKGKVLLIDPWFPQNGAFFGSWYQYPPNHHLLDSLVQESFDIKDFFIFVSHEHQDHFDVQTLKLFSKNTKILIPNYSNRFLKKEIKRLGFECIFLEHFKKYKISNTFYVMPILSEVGVNTDCAILIKTRKFCFFNQNDCKVFELIDRIEEKINFYSVQFSGATTHPNRFILNKKKIKSMSAEKVDNKLKNVISAIKKLKPDYYLPAAGPAIFPFLKSSLSYGRGDNIFIHQKELNDILIKNGITNTIYMRPGEEFSENLKVPILPPNKEDLNNYRNSISNYWDRIISNFNPIHLKIAIKKRLSKIKDIEINECPVLVFRWGDKIDELFVINLNLKTIYQTFDYGPKYFEVLAEKKYFYFMSQNYRWQDISLSMRAKYKRVPDVFNNYVNLFLFSDIKTIRNSFFSTLNIKSERVVIKNKKNVRYQIDRYCPHQGADLCKANIDSSNNLICPRHSWKFNLDKNGYHKNTDTSINSIKV